LHVTNETAKHALTRAHVFSFGGQEVCEHRFLKDLVFMHVSNDVSNDVPIVFPKHHNLIQMRSAQSSPPSHLRRWAKGDGQREKTSILGGVKCSVF